MVFITSLGPRLYLLWSSATGPRHHQANRPDQEASGAATQPEADAAAVQEEAPAAANQQEAPTVAGLEQTVTDLDGEECIICLGPINPELRIECRAQCHRGFHGFCLEEWSESQYATLRCPHCRTPWQWNDDRL